MININHIEELSADEFDLDAMNAMPVFDAAEELTDDGDIALFLNGFLDETDAGMIAHALGIAARARGMTQMARDTGISREALYKALRADSAPRLDTIIKVIKALGYRLTVEPIAPAPAEILPAVSPSPPSTTEPSHS